MTDRPYTSVLSKATALDVCRSLAGVASATRPRRLQLREPGRPGRRCSRAATCPPPWAEHTAACGRPKSASDTSRLTLERRRATGPPSGLDCPLHHPSGRDPTVPRTAGRPRNGRSPYGSGVARASSASCGGCTSSFTSLDWRQTRAIDTPTSTTAPPLPIPSTIGRDRHRDSDSLGRARGAHADERAMKTGLVGLA